MSVRASAEASSRSSTLTALSAAKAAVLTEAAIASTQIQGFTFVFIEFVLFVLRVETSTPMAVPGKLQLVQRGAESSHFVGKNRPSDGMNQALDGADGLIVHNAVVNGCTVEIGGESQVLQGLLDADPAESLRRRPWMRGPWTLKMAGRSRVISNAINIRIRL